MKTRIIRSAGILFLSMLMVTAVDAQRPNRNGRGQGPCGAGDGPAYGMHARMGQMPMLDLSEEQQAEITSLRTEQYKAVKPLKNKMAELKARERTLLSEESVDMKAVNKTIDEQTELAASIRKLQVGNQVAIKGLLTDEQLMKLDQRKMYAQRDGNRARSGQRGDAFGRGYHGR